MTRKIHSGRRAAAQLELVGEPWLGDGIPGQRGDARGAGASHRESGEATAQGQCGCSACTKIVRRCGEKTVMPPARMPVARAKAATKRPRSADERFGSLR